MSSVALVVGEYELFVQSKGMLKILDCMDCCDLDRSRGSSTN